MKAELTAYVRDHLFSTPEEMKKARLTVAQQERLYRLRDMYNYWKQYPNTADKDIVVELRRRNNIGSSVAYEDLRLLKTCLGAFNQVTKDWDRYRFRQMVEETYALARRNNDAAAMAKALAAYGKYAMLDKEECDAPAYSDIVVQVLRPTDDPSSLGFKPIKDFREKAEKLYRQFSQDAVETEFEEVKE